ncbi:Hypothetical protein PHPALM_18333 [Phytophthora palmivora]|uniref:Reverse transcriptase n=1 Tax=Phytophthora palmivora TaxID=4796 RepID=A0A2P4XK04_9STRA|nr:Hypothetical protein PHPALM_18333 [Phytophthora palmivora]
MVLLGSTTRQDREPRRWRYRIQMQYQLAREQVNEQLREAIQGRADRHNEPVRPRHARKLAHMWHEPFRVLELVDEYAVCMEIAGKEYRLFPVVHVSKIKPVRQIPYRPQIRLTIPDQDRYDFDEALLPEDSWIRDLDNNEYEVEKIDATNQREWMKPILTAELYCMTICEIERIEIDSRSCSHMKSRKEARS